MKDAPSALINQELINSLRLGNYKSFRALYQEPGAENSIYIFCYLTKLYLNKREKISMAQQGRKCKQRQQSSLNGADCGIYDFSPLPPIQIVLSLASTLVGLVLCQVGCGSQPSRQHPVILTPGVHVLVQSFPTLNRSQNTLDYWD